MPEAFISITTSWASGVGYRNCFSSNPRSPVNTTPRMVSSRFVLVGGGEFDRKMRGWQRDSQAVTASQQVGASPQPVIPQGVSSTPRPLDFTTLALEYWIVRLLRIWWRDARV